MAGGDSAEHAVGTLLDIYSQGLGGTVPARGAPSAALVARGRHRRTILGDDPAHAQVAAASSWSVYSISSPCRGWVVASVGG